MMNMCDYSRSENVRCLLAVKNSPFSEFFFNFWRVFWVNDGNSLFNDNVYGHPGFLSYCTERKFRWHKIWESWWPKSTPDNAITEEVLQKSYCCFTVWMVTPLAEISNCIHSFPAGQGMSQKIWIISLTTFSSKNNGPTINFQDIMYQMPVSDNSRGRIFMHVIFFWHSIFHCFDY